MGNYRIIERTDSANKITYVVEKWNGWFFAILTMTPWLFFGEYKTLKEAEEWVLSCKSTDASLIEKSRKEIKRI